MNSKLNKFLIKTSKQILKSKGKKLTTKNLVKEYHKLCYGIGIFLDDDDTDYEISEEEEYIRRASYQN